MNYYILFYQAVENYIELRAPFRGAHLELIKKYYDEGYLVMAGAYAEPADGAALVFKADSPEKAEEFAKNDPYILNGLITHWEVRKWTVVIGG